MPFKGQGRRRLLGAGLGSVLGSALASLTGCAKPREKENPWKSAYQLDASRGRLSGSEEALAAAIRRGADLRIRTEFKNNEHIDTGSDNAEAIQEVAEFGRPAGHRPPLSGWGRGHGRTGPHGGG